MIFLALAAAVVVVIQLWLQLNAMRATIAGLTARVRALEQRHAADPEKAPKPLSQAPEPPPLIAPSPLSATTGPPSGSAAERPTPPPLRPPPPPIVSVEPGAGTIPASRADARDALESRIGSRWLLYIGVVAIVVGVSYFEKLAIDNQWVSETARVIQGAVLGLALVAAGLRFVKAGYRLYGQIVSGSGIAILYVSTYAAFNFYHLVSPAVAFALMTGITTLGGWLADRQESQGLALVAVGGGFATPFLLQGSTDAEVALFGYETILIAGTMVLSRRRDWPALNIVSYAFTVVTVAAWATRFYDASKYLTTELFLTLFCGMFVSIRHDARRSHHPSTRDARAILWTGPFGYYFASLAILSPHSPALLVYLVLLALVGVIVSSRTGARMRLAFWVAVALPLLLWSGAHGGRTWLVAGGAAWTGVYLLNLAGLLEATLETTFDAGRGFSEADIALLHLNGLATFAGAYLLLEPVSVTACAGLAAGLSLLNAVLCRLRLNRRREEALHCAALAFSLLTIAIALEFDGPSVISGWAAEGAVVIWLGLRERRGWLRIAGLLLFAVAVARLFVLQFADPPVGQLLLFNPRALCGLFIVSLAYLVTLAHHRDGDSPWRVTETGVGLVTAKLLLLALAASEIVAYWTLHTPPPFEPAAQVIDASLITGVVMIWLGLKRRQEWVRGIGAITFACGAYALFAVQMEAAPAGYVSVLNGRVASGVFAVIMIYGLTALHRRMGAHLTQLSGQVAVLATAASVLTLSLLTSEIDAFWAVRGAERTVSINREALQAIVWAGLGGFVVWQGLSNRRLWIRVVGGAILAIAVQRLLLVQIAEVSSTYLVVANARVIAALVVIAVLYGVAHLYRDAGDAAEARYAPATVLCLIANVLTLTLLTSETTTYWRIHDLQPAASQSANSRFAREMMLSITWAVYATLLIVVGLRKRYAPIRYFAMVVFVVTIVKVFALDLAELDQIYRVLSVVGLGVALLLTSYLYQRVQAKPRL